MTRAINNRAQPALCWLFLVFTLLPACALAVPEAQSEQAESAPAAENDPWFEAESDDIEELLAQADILLRAGRPIDARAKLQRVLRLAPEDHRAYIKLGYYYLTEVGHFKLAYRYLKTAEKLFYKRAGSASLEALDSDLAFDHALLLHLVAEAELNLDKYEDSLRTLDRFERFYWMDWYPGTRAWVLMKLKRIEEAIRVAQAGLLRGGDPRQTWNILGILFSVTDSRQLSLDAFGQSIRAELLTGGGQIATPLNNAGEVYREMFRDDVAEAAWLHAIRLPDGCDHILPSLNLSIMYVDQLRLFNAERVLQDFENCFAERSLREDTEHRTLLALSRGRIALRKNDIDKAITLLTLAAEEQQWFGKIGTNENDVRFAATIGMAQALSAKAAVIADTHYSSYVKAAADWASLPILHLRSWWLNRTARKIALEELDDLEDLLIRNTDTMLEYPTFGSVLADFNGRSLEKRLSRMTEKDDRPLAHAHYRLYVAENYLRRGRNKQAEEILRSLLDQWRPIDRLAAAETLALLIEARQAQRSWWQSSTEEAKETAAMKERLFALLPSHLRYHDLALPVSFEAAAGSEPERTAARQIIKALASRRFEEPPAGFSPNRRLVVTCRPGAKPGVYAAGIELVDAKTNRTLIEYSGEIAAESSDRSEILNNFIAKAFSHQVDPVGDRLPAIPILEGILRP